MAQPKKKTADPAMGTQEGSTGDVKKKREASGTKNKPLSDAELAKLQPPRGGLTVMMRYAIVLAAKNDFKLQKNPADLLDVKDASGKLTQRPANSRFGIVSRRGGNMIKVKDKTTGVETMKKMSPGPIWTLSDEEIAPVLAAGKAAQGDISKGAYTQKVADFIEAYFSLKGHGGGGGGAKKSNFGFVSGIEL